MADIWTGVTFVTAVFVLIASLTTKYARTASARTRTVLAVVSVLLGCVYVWFLQDDVRIAGLLPVSNIIVVGKGAAYFTAVLIGLVATEHKLSAVRRVLACALLTGATGFATIEPVLSDVPDCSNYWHDDVCIQSTDHTCAAACAATLLRSIGYKTTEQEMAQLCLSDHGTTWSGLYRGLNLKTAQTRYRVKTFVCDMDELRTFDLSQRPAILTVCLTYQSARENPNFIGKSGWVPGLSHTVLLYGFTDDGRVEIGDPSVGREFWNVEELDVLWQRSGQMLVAR